MVVLATNLGIMGRYIKIKLRKLKESLFNLVSVLSIKSSDTITLTHYRKNALHEKKSGKSKYVDFLSNILYYELIISVHVKFQAYNQLILMFYIIL